MPDWSFEIGVNLASWFVAADCTTCVSLTSRSQSYLPETIPNPMSSPLASPLKIPISSAHTHTDTNQQCSRVSFRASSLRFVLRCTFQLMLLSLAVGNILFQFRALSAIISNFDSHFACFYSKISLISVSSLFFLHIGQLYLPLNVFRPFIFL